MIGNLYPFGDDLHAENLGESDNRADDFVGTLFVMVIAMICS